MSSEPTPTISATAASQKSSVQTITGMRRWTDTLFSFRTTRPEGFSYLAGQYARLGLPLEPGGQMIWRPYSMVSAPHEDELEFYSILVPSGRFTPLLNQAEAGSPIHVEKQVYGFMTADRFDDGDTLWLLSTGTGIGPFIGMLREQTIWQRFGRIILVHCVRHARELAYTEELRRMQASPPVPSSRLTLIQTVTREAPTEPGMLEGRITTLIADGGLERAAGEILRADSARIMMCGNPEMIEELRALLRDRGMRPHRRAAPGQYISENYW